MHASFNYYCNHLLLETFVHRAVVSTRAVSTTKLIAPDTVSKGNNCHCSSIDNRLLPKHLIIIATITKLKPRLMRIGNWAVVKYFRPADDRVAAAQPIRNGKLY